MGHFNTATTARQGTNHYKSDGSGWGGGGGRLGRKTKKRSMRGKRTDKKTSHAPAKTIITQVMAKTKKKQQQQKT